MAHSTDTAALLASVQRDFRIRKDSGQDPNRLRIWWHKRIDEIAIATSNGDAMVYTDPAIFDEVEGDQSVD